MKKFAFLLAGLFPFFAFSQTITLRGKVTDKATKEPLYGAVVKVKVDSLMTGAICDGEARFEIRVDFNGRPDAHLEVTYVGYLPVSMKIYPATDVLDLEMEPGSTAGREVVISGSRVSENLMESPVSIEKMSAAEIRNAPSGDFYQGLGNFKGVDIVTSSLGFKVINTRGFSSTSPVRSVQFIDGMDNAAPGLNFPVGNLVGASDLDLNNVELISGASSALYGPNAFQGVVSMTTKNPYDYQGMSIMLKGGSRDWAEGAFRYAQTVGPSKKLALKLTGSYMRANDWPATDTAANVYGDIETTQDLSAILRELQYDSTLTQEERDDYIALNNYLDFNPAANPGKVDIKAPGYLESDIADYTTKSLKLGAELHYRIKDSLQLSFAYKLGNGTAVYQGTNRYSIKNILFQQQKVELTGKRFSVKAYNVMENAGDSYDLIFTAINLSKNAVPDYIGAYLGRYFEVLDTLTNGFDNDAKIWMADSARREAVKAADTTWLRPGHGIYDSLFNAIITNPDLQEGAKFQDRSSYQHIEGQYNFDLKGLELIAGASGRRYNPQSFGTIFSDTLIDKGDTLANGNNDPKGDYYDISLWEAGGYVQAGKRFFKDHLKIMASVRGDKNKNFKPQFSPRISAVLTVKQNHNFRVSAQSAFRMPTLQNQYILLDLGPLTLQGNLNGLGNLYTWQSVQDFRDDYDTTNVINTSLLKTITLDPLQPENVKTIEIGYRGIFREKLFVDANLYFSRYKHFIGDIRVVQPLNGVAGEESGENDILTNTSDIPTYQLYQMPVNSKETVQSYGGAVSANYYFGKGISLSGNYTYAYLDTSKVTDDIIPGFNTPTHKINLGVTGRNVWKNLGFSANWKWVSNFRWESSFGIGDVPSFNILDLQISYEFPDYHSTLRFGSSNALNFKHIEAYGSPMVGRMVYASWTFDWDKLSGEKPFSKLVKPKE